MRLTRLSANHDTFKTVNFNDSGLTLIVGSKSTKGETYNGVGKSLIIELIHFCLGSNKIPAFEEKISHWEFTLEFEMAGAKHSISRNTSNQSDFTLNNQTINQKSLNAWLEERAFSTPSDVGFLTFRSLLPKFLRRGNAQYIDPRDTGDRGDYERLLRNAFLLGIDTHIIAKKAELRDEIVRIQGLRSNFKKDTLLRDFYAGGKDTDIHLSHLDREIRRLELDRQKFAVAENYYEIQKIADALADSIEKEKNAAFLIKNSIENIENSMREQPDVPLERIQLLYGELTNAFKPESLRRLEELSVFHKKLLENRIARLSKEKLRLLNQKSAHEKSIKKKQAELDAHLKFLGGSRALDQYTAIVNKIADLQGQAQKLRDYQNLALEYSNKEASLKGQMSEEVVKANTYLEETRDIRERTFNLFKEYVAGFYPTKVAGISLKNNDGDNKLRFDLDVHIENDSSDGINEVRIFCYDLMLLTLRQGHKIGFIFHDSRLFANMDVRQRAKLFRLAHEVTSSLGLQYIATLNPDFISGMDAEFSPEEMKALISDKIVLQLKDDSPTGKLLGIQVDMQY